MNVCFPLTLLYLLSFSFSFCFLTLLQRSSSPLSPHIFPSSFLQSFSLSSHYCERWQWTDTSRVQPAVKTQKSIGKKENTTRSKPGTVQYMAGLCTVNVWNWGCSGKLQWKTAVEPRCQMNHVVASCLHSAKNQPIFLVGSIGHLMDFIYCPVQLVQFISERRFSLSVR